MWVGVVKRFAFALVRDGGRRKEKREVGKFRSDNEYYVVCPLKHLRGYGEIC